MKTFDRRSWNIKNVFDTTGGQSTERADNVSHVVVDRDEDVNWRHIDLMTIWCRELLNIHEGLIQNQIGLFHDQRMVDV